MNNIKKHSFNSLDDLDPSKVWDICFIGEACDKRGVEVSEYLSPRCGSIHSIVYKTEKGGNLTIDGEITGSRDMKLRVKGKCNILLEATTLGVTEILSILKYLGGEADLNIELIYLEPKEYLEPKVKNLLNSREFSLGNNNSYIGIKSFHLDLQMHETGDAIFLLGFEGARLAQAVEQNSLSNWRKHAIFGIPAFEAGWEMNSFANNVNYIASERFSSIRYSGASNVFDTLDELNKIHGAKNTDEPTLIIPIGTKPMSIAAALFLCGTSRFQSTGILFDHPIKKNDRSLEIRRCHIYSGISNVVNL